MGALDDLREAARTLRDRAQAATRGRGAWPEVDRA
jgi:hypothetical protein